MENVSELALEDLQVTGVSSVSEVLRIWSPLLGTVMMGIKSKLGTTLVVWRK